MEGERVSYHESVQRVLERIRRDGLTNLWDRYEAQGFGGDPDRRCPFCMAGVRCDLCSNGPCRADAEKDKRGVCGISADGMAMRMMLLRNLLGASTYLYHAQEALRTLRATAEGRSPFSIREPERLRTLAVRLGLKGDGAPREVALELCALVESDFARATHEPSRIVEALAPEERRRRWSELGILPGGIWQEIVRATGSCLTNVDGYYGSLALKAMRLSVAMAYQAQLILEAVQDSLYGTPRPHRMRVDLGVLEPEYVNVLVNGHEPFLGFALVELARSPEWQRRAQEAGAKGLRVIACIETGQEMIQRWEMDEVFWGFTGNWISQEPVLASGCVDLFACDMNCSLPLDPLYAQRYRFRLIPVSELVAFEGVEERLDYHPERAQEQASELLGMAVENFRRRSQEVEPLRGLPMEEAVVGFSTESILEALGGSLAPLLEAIKEGRIRGVAGLISCTSLRDTGQDVHTVRVAKELIARDVLVLAMGCGNAALQVAGLSRPEAREQAGEGLRGLCEALGVPPVLSFGTCTDTGRLADLLAAVAGALGVAIPELPVVAVAPEYMEQKATIDAIFALALGLYTYVNPVPPVTGAPNLVRLLAEGCRDLTGGRLALETDPVAAVEGMLDHIEQRRKALGL